MRLDPTVTFLIVLAIGIVAGLVFDRFAGPGWLTRQIAGRRGMITSALVGIAGSFVGYHLAVLASVTGAATLIGAAIGAFLVLWLWRAMR